MGGTGMSRKAGIGGRANDNPGMGIDGTFGKLGKVGIAGRDGIGGTGMSIKDGRGGKAKDSPGILTEGMDGRVGSFGIVGRDGIGGTGISKNAGSGGTGIVTPGTVILIHDISQPRNRGSWGHSPCTCQNPRSDDARQSRGRRHRIGHRR